MRHSSGFVALLLLAVLASGAAAQGKGQGRRQGPPGAGPGLLRDSLPGRGPIEVLLARGDSLDLSREQVTQLQALDTDLQRQNAPLIERLINLRREIQPLIGVHPRDMTAAQREQFARQAERARPIMQQVQENNQRAMERVGELLTPEQRTRLRNWLQRPGRMGPLHSPEP